MTEATDIWKAIEERRAHFEAIIEKANATIESARALIREAREGLDALPVAKVRRPKRVKPVLTLNGVDERDGV